MSSLLGLLSVGRMKMASMGTAPVFPVRSLRPLIQPRCWENSSSLIITMSSPFLKLRRVESSVEEEAEEGGRYADISEGNLRVAETPASVSPRLSASFRVMAYWDRSVRPLMNMVISSAMSSVVRPLRPKSPLRVTSLTACPLEPLGDRGGAGGEEGGRGEPQNTHQTFDILCQLFFST